MFNYLWPHGLYSLWNSPGQNTGVGSLSLLQGNLPNPGIEPRSSALRADSLQAEPPAKPNSTRLLIINWGNTPGDWEGRRRIIQLSLAWPKSLFRFLHTLLGSHMHRMEKTWIPFWPVQHVSPGKLVLMTMESFHIPGLFQWTQHHSLSTSWPPNEHFMWLERWVLSDVITSTLQT